MIRIEPARVIPMDPKSNESAWICLGGTLSLQNSPAKVSKIRQITKCLQMNENEFELAMLFPNDSRCSTRLNS